MGLHHVVRNGPGAAVDDDYGKLSQMIGLCVAALESVTKSVQQALDGYNSVVEGLIDLGLFLLSSGPSLLIWTAILFFQARWLWRKLRAGLKKRHEQWS
jgi:hypothetical protein